MNKKIKRILTAMAALRFPMRIENFGVDESAASITIVWILYDDGTVKRLEIMRGDEKYCRNKNCFYIPFSDKEARQILEFATEPITRL